MVHPDSIGKLSTVFSNTTNSYKFYWFLAILNKIKTNGDKAISIDELLIDMLDMVSYPLDYYKLSFGAQDGFKDIVQEINTHFEIDYGVKAKNLNTQLEENFTHRNRIRVLQKIKNLNRYVPYRLLRPFFSEQTRGLKDADVNSKIKHLSEEAARNQPGYCPYHFSEKNIIIDDSWHEFFRSNIGLLESFCHWHLIRFIQSKNPNVPGISTKLYKPQERQLTPKRAAWRNFLSDYPQTRSIYTGQILTPGFSIDHFIPWTFVTHDLNWNLTPVENEVNSSKSNNIPSFDNYFSLFSDQQYSFMIWSFKMNHKKINEEYCNLFRGGIGELTSMPFDRFRKHMEETLKPMAQIAENLGFFGGWVYR